MMLIIKPLFRHKIHNLKDEKQLFVIEPLYYDETVSDDSLVFFICFVLCHVVRFPLCSKC